MNERPMIIPRDVWEGQRVVFSNGQYVGLILSDEGRLAERVSRATGLPFNPFDFALGIYGLHRKVEHRS